MNEISIPLDRPATANPDGKVSTSSSHIPALDGLRGLAVLLVIFYHLSTFSFEGRGLAVSSVGAVIHYGWMGVEIFFTLSGFLITNILVSTVNDPHYFRSFYIRRALRIFPLYYGVLALVAICGLPLHMQWNGSFAYLTLYVQNYLPTTRLWLQSPLGILRLSHFWSLAVEEQFYLVWPFLVWMFKGRTSFFAVPIALIALGPIARWIAMAHGVAPFAVYTWTPFRLDGLAWGALGALVLRRNRHRATQILRWVSMTAGAGLLVYILSGRLLWTNSIAALGMSTCGVLLSISQPGTVLERIFRASFLRWFGRYSYGIYVYHYIFMGLFGYPRDYVDRVTGSRPLGALTMLVCGVAFSSALAWISYHAYERRFLKLKNVFGRYAEVRPRPSSLHS